MEAQPSACSRAAEGKRASVIGICCNLGLFLAKLLAGLLSGSLSVAADAFNNMSDASSSLISLLGFKLGEKPADPEHPYGHGRYSRFCKPGAGTSFRRERRIDKRCAGEVLPITKIIRTWNTFLLSCSN